MSHAVREEGREQAEKHKETRRRGTDVTMVDFLATASKVSPEAVLRDLIDLSELVHTNQSFQGIESPFRRLAVGASEREISADTARRRLSLLHGIAVMDTHERFRSASSFSIAFDFGSTPSGKDVCMIVYSAVDRNFDKEEYVLDVVNLRSTGHFAKPNTLAIARRLDIHSADNQILYTASTDTASCVRAIAETLVTNFTSAVEEAHAFYYDAVEDMASFDDMAADDGDDHEDDVGSARVRLRRRGRGVAANEGDRALKCVCHGTVTLASHFSSL